MALDIAALVRTTAAEKGFPGVAVGIVRPGEPLEVFATGTRVLDANLEPDAMSVFRIASMTKSFTAAAVLLLRDRGQLALDDIAQRYLPWLDDQRITIRDLLTMNAGFPTDDPWGDRHEGTPLDQFDALVARGLSRIRATRTGFEYSNLGYALLGRVVHQITGRDYTEFVETELLAPLGMMSTRFNVEQVPESLLATGYHPVAAGLVAEPPTPPGAFSPMGGLHSNVADLAKWVQGFLDAHAGIEGHPLSVSSRLEMQQPQNFSRLVVGAEPGVASSLSYGFGLIAVEHSMLGRTVLHSGGYPGYGSHMRWHPATGIGVIGLANRTYAGMWALCEAIANALVAEAEPQVSVADSLWPETREAMNAAEALLHDWDDDLADALFAHNMDLDIPRAERIARAREVGGNVEQFVRDAASLTSRSAAHVRWQVTAKERKVAIELLMSPDAETRVQMLTFDPTEL